MNSVENLPSIALFDQVTLSKEKKTANQSNIHRHSNMHENNW